MELFKYGCGCKGFSPCTDGTVYVLDLCDEDDSGTGLVPRIMREESVRDMKPLGEKETEEFVSEISSLLRDGHNMRTLKRLVS
jgi:hypothetical protein